MIINIFGLTVEYQSESPNLTSKLIRPFKYYVKENGSPSIKIIVKEVDPPYETFPSIKASFSTPRNIIFKDKNCKIIDYFGKGMILEESNKSTYTIFSRDINFLQEAFYLLILSLFGQFCDKKGLLRIHALAFSYNDSAIILTMPSGGGKSTMALTMLEEEGFKLMSEDEAVFDNSGHINPFHSRIGVLNKSDINFIPDEYIYMIDRMEFGIKYFVDCEYWKDKLEHKPNNEIILFISQRLINGEPCIEKTSKINAFRSLLINAVIGVGLYQGIEFVFNNSALDILSKFPIFVRRFVLALKLISASKTYRISLSRDVNRNAQVLMDFTRNLK